MGDHSAKFNSYLLFACWAILHAFKLSANLFSNWTFSTNSFLEIPSVYQTVWIQMRPNTFLDLLWIQTVRKGDQHKTPASRVMFPLFLTLLEGKICNFLYKRYWTFGKFRENFIFANSLKRHICHFKNSRQGHDFNIYQQMTEWSRHFARILFSWNFASAKFRENKTLRKILNLLKLTKAFIHLL